MNGLSSSSMHRLYSYRLSQRILSSGKSPSFAVVEKVSRMLKEPLFVFMPQGLFVNIGSRLSDSSGAASHALKGFVTSHRFRPSRTLTEEDFASPQVMA